MQTFHEGDHVRVKPSQYLQPKFHGADGVIVAWCHDNIYRVKLDAFTTESVFNANELTSLCKDHKVPICAECGYCVQDPEHIKHQGE